MSAARQRRLQRTVHLAAGVVILASVYGLHSALLDDALRFVLLPLLVATGLAMWQAPRIRRLRRRTRHGSQNVSTHG